MTITNTTRSVTHTGNGSTTTWPYAFIIPDSGSHVVSLLEISTGVAAVLSTSVYTVSGLGDSGGGNVEYPLSGSPIASTHKLVITREVPRTQTTNITNQTRYFADVVMAVWDRIVMMVQELTEGLSRSLRAPIDDGGIGDLPRATERASKLLGFDSSGDPMASEGATSGVAVSAYIATVLDDETADEALATLTAVGGSTPGLAGPLDTDGYAILGGRGSDVMSGTNIDVFQDGNWFYLTGTTDIETIDDDIQLWDAGSIITLKMQGASLTLIHSSPNLSLPGGGNITVYAGDILSFVCTAAGDWDMLSRIPAALSVNTEGSFTATLTGVNATVTGTAYWVRYGNQITFHIPELSGTSNTTACTITGIPAEFTSASPNPEMPIVVKDNSATAVGTALWSGGSYLVIDPAVSTGTWTASGTKKVERFSLTCYMIPV